VATKRRPQTFRLGPDEVLTAVAEFVRRHKDDSPPGAFCYYVTIEADGGATILSAKPPSKKQAKKWEAQLRQRAALTQSKREALH
jgi:hypothetical protein